MSILGWIVFGLIAGWIASKIINRRGEGCFLNVALGIAGAVVGGALFSLARRAHLLAVQPEIDVRGCAGRSDRAGPVPRGDRAADATLRLHLIRRNSLGYTII